MRVLVADSDPRVRKALSMLLRLEPELAIVGESTDASSLLAQVIELEPDLVLLDWELPGSPITTLIERLRKKNVSLPRCTFSRHGPHRSITRPITGSAAATWRAAACLSYRLTVTM